MGHQLPPVPPKTPAIEIKTTTTARPVVDIHFEDGKVGRTVIVHFVPELCDVDKSGTITCYIPGGD